MKKKEIRLNNLEQTKIFASKLAKIAKVGDIITFSGELGAGKTSFIQYFIQSLSEKNIEITKKIVLELYCKIMKTLSNLNHKNAVAIYRSFIKEYI